MLEDRGKLISPCLGFLGHSGNYLTVLDFPNKWKPAVQCRFVVLIHVGNTDFKCIVADHFKGRQYIVCNTQLKTWKDKAWVKLSKCQSMCVQEPFLKTGRKGNQKEINKLLINWNFLKMKHSLQRLSPMMTVREKSLKMKWEYYM